MTIIGISGYARSGKDLFTSVAQKILKEHNIKSEKFALAYELKLDLYPLVMNKLWIDTFTDDTKSKSVIRPLLVAYGDLMRKTSEGKYWTNKIEQSIFKSKADVVFVTDIRYDVYPEDECAWLQNKQRGKLIHITKFKHGPVPTGKRFSKNKIVKIYDAAPNDHELLNNPKIKEKANYAFEWEDCSDKLSGSPLEDNPYIKEKVTEALKAINAI